MNLLDKCKAFKERMIEDEINNGEIPDYMKQGIDSKHFDHDGYYLFEYILKASPYGYDKNLTYVFGHPSVKFKNAIKCYNQELKMKIVDYIVKRFEKVLDRIDYREKLLDHVYLEKEKLKHLVEGNLDEKNIYLTKEEWSNEKQRYLNLFEIVLSYEVGLLNDEEFMEHYVLAIKYAYTSPYIKRKISLLKVLFKLELFEYVWFKNKKENMEKLKEKIKEWYQTEKPFEIDYERISFYEISYLMNKNELVEFIKKQEDRLDKQLQELEESYTKTGSVDHERFRIWQFYLSKIEQLKKEG